MEEGQAAVASCFLNVYFSFLPTLINSHFLLHRQEKSKRIGMDRRSSEQTVRISHLDPVFNRKLNKNIDLRNMFSVFGEQSNAFDIFKPSKKYRKNVRCQTLCASNSGKTFKCLKFKRVAFYLASGRARWSVDLRR